MTERQFNEIERVLLHLSDAQRRARKAVQAVEADGADDHVIAALTNTEHELGELHRKLAQGTYYAVANPTRQ